MTHCSEYLHVKLSEQKKNVLSDTLQFPVPSWQTRMWCRGGKMEEQSGECTVERGGTSSDKCERSRGGRGNVLFLSGPDMLLSSSMEFSQTQTPKRTSRLHSCPSSEQHREVWGEELFVLWSGPPQSPLWSLLTQEAAVMPVLHGTRMCWSWRIMSMIWALTEAVWMSEACAAFRDQVDIHHLSCCRRPY